MLQGSLDTVSFDEVLGFLASSSKTGVLRISGDRGTGSVWVTDGQMVAAETTQGGADSSLEEVVFELLRFNSGTFAFDFDETNSNPGSPMAIEGVLAQANKLLVEWRGIEEVITSLEHRISPAPRLPADQVTITEDEWSTLLAVGTGATVAEVASHLHLGQLEGLRRMKGLVERKLVLLTEPQSDQLPEQTAMDSAAPAVAADVPATPAAQPAPVPEPAAAASEVADAGPVADNSVQAPKAEEPLGFEAPEVKSSAAATAVVPPPVAPSARRLSARRAEAEQVSEPKPAAPSVFVSAIPAPPPAPAPAPVRAKIEDNLDDPFGSDEARPPMPPPPPPAPSAAPEQPMGADVPPPPAPPSPAEIAKFGTSVEDASSIQGSGEGESDGETSLLMRYLQSEG